MTVTSPMSRHRTTAALAALAAAAVALGHADAVLAAPKPAETELRADLARFKEKVGSLAETYAAKRGELKKAQQAEAVARKDLRKAETVYEEAREKAAAVTPPSQPSGAQSTVAVLFTPDLGGTAVMERFAAEQGAHLMDLAAGVDRRKEAVEKAVQLTGETREEVKEARARRDEAKEAVGDIKGKLGLIAPLGSGRRADGTWVAQSPTGAENITDRTRIMRDAVMRRFDLPYTVGCYRSTQDGGEHPLGRACDFMMSTGGAMPSAANLKLGDEIAAWAIKNKDRLGVKYVIWRQRINHGSGWRAMSDRGSVTANHFDHPHISMY
ncbi:hypothetical protein FHS43_001570 [Streptosporangium becharense]|uniref:ARB-07466-like C-terminal domain-containing protein n=1 Tax=Streptosporangium becharense TaxID=1816182 RepID=A0A7W9ILP1_9ACTN|nr:hypothetical protein [Streptosporangium becharense]MBB2910307.1 hypothetical protein [Streptosporangium becharense]MBB5823050.1 hypothetical protein [Streptosporangium becharense]